MCFLFILLTTHIHFSVHKKLIATIHSVYSVLPQINRHQFISPNSNFSHGPLIQHGCCLVDIAQLWLLYLYGCCRLLLHSTDSHLGSVRWSHEEDMKLSLAWSCGMDTAFWQGRTSAERPCSSMVAYLPKWVRNMRCLS